MRISNKMIRSMLSSDALLRFEVESWYDGDFDDLILYKNRGLLRRFYFRTMRERAAGYTRAFTADGTAHSVRRLWND